MSPANNERPKRADDAEIKGPLGWSMRFPARYLSSTLIAVMGIGFLAYMIRDHDLRQTTMLAEVNHAREAQMQKVLDKQDALQENIEITNYLISLTVDERERIKLDMPPALRAKLLTQERR